MLSRIFVVTFVVADCLFFAFGLFIAYIGYVINDGRGFVNPALGLLFGVSITLFLIAEMIRYFIRRE